MKLIEQLILTGQAESVIIRRDAPTAAGAIHVTITRGTNQSARSGNDLDILVRGCMVALREMEQVQNVEKDRARYAPPTPRVVEDRRGP
jgi:hypothetical protein